MNMPLRKEPIINAPAVIVVVLAMLLAIHGARQFIDQSMDEWVLLHLAFFPSRLGTALVDLPGGQGLAISSLVSYSFLHGDWMHLFINSAWFLAFGSLIARRTSVLGFLALCVVTSVAGGLAYLAANFGQATPIIGASGVVSGLMGAAFRVIFSGLDVDAFGAIRGGGHGMRRMPLTVAVRDRRVMLSTLVWVGVNLLFAFGLSGVFTDGGIAWEAHLGGFFAGFLLFGLFDQGPGWYGDWQSGERLHS
ncbi:MAG TPA: rhomboid family intramembrane serine protease [Hyphomicrobiaceae bacterium]|nr:rhomboid family intramembrane serine protease [Hyphomicrobiaceae bacterium]